MIGQKIEQVAKVVTRMKTKPFDGLPEDQPRNEHDFGEVDGVNALLLVFFELNAAVL